MRSSALLASVVISGFAGSAAFGQHVGITSTRSAAPAPVGAYRYGNILYPGGIPHQYSHAGRLGATVAGNPYPGIRPGGIGPGGMGPGGVWPGGMGPGGVRPGYPGGRPRTVVVPYAYPVFVGGGGYYDGYAQEPSTNVTVVVPQQPAPQVIINNSYVPETAKPVVREYSQGEPSESSGIRVYEGGQPRATTNVARDNGNGTSIMDEKATIYLIALKDGTVRQAIGYWQQGETFHYITPDSSINHLSLAMVDRHRSIELNAERKLEFDLRPPR